jgi:hypothetical protein
MAPSGHALGARFNVSVAPEPEPTADAIAKQGLGCLLFSERFKAGIGRLLVTVFYISMKPCL